MTMTELSQLNIPVLDIDVDTTIYVDNVKVVISVRGIISVYFDETIRCCYLNYTHLDWHLELGSYAENRDSFIIDNPGVVLPVQLATGTSTVYFISALAYCLHIDLIKLLDSAQLPETDIELSVIKLVLGQPTFYEKFGYQASYPNAHQNFISQLKQLVVSRPNFYTACFDFYYRRTEFDHSTINVDIFDTISGYHDNHVDTMIKHISITDLWFYQLSSHTH
jgi:hypothetical protein